MTNIEGNKKPIIEVKNLSKTYSGITVLKNVDFMLFPGEVHALIGENGAGKSTLIKVIVGAEKPDKFSEIYFDGIQVYNMNPSKSMQLGISVIYQDISMFPNLTISENLFMGRQEGVLFRKKTMMNKATEAFKDVNIEIDPHIKLKDLSLGQQQIVAIVKAVTSNSKVVIMDEPTSSLAGNEADMLFRLISELKKKGIGIIYISHKLDEVIKLADRITVLRDGENVASDTVESFDYQKLVRLMVGRELRFIPMLNDKKLGKIIFEVKNLNNHLVNDISFCVHEHEIVGLTGLVGAGRSELAQSIFGIHKLDKGEIFIRSEKVTIKDTYDAINKGISYLTEDRQTQGMFKGQSVTWNATASIIDRIVDSMNLVSEAKERKIIEGNISALQIKPNRPMMNVESLSGGNQQKVMIGKWLNTKPKVLIIDEPTCGVDVGTKLEIHKLLRELANEGVAVILISSDLTEIMAISDRIMVMRQGHIVDTLDSSDATMEKILSKGLLG